MRRMTRWVAGAVAGVLLAAGVAMVAMVATRPEAAQGWTLRLDGDVQAGGAGDSAALVALDPARRHAFVIANFPSTSPSRVSLIDTETGALIRATTVGFNARAVVIDGPAGRAFVVVDARGGSVSMLDARTGAFLRSFSLHGVAPQAAALDDRAGRLVLRMEAGHFHGIGVYDVGPAGLRPRARVPVPTTTGAMPYGDSATRDAAAQRAFVATSERDAGGNVTGGSVQAIDTTTGKAVWSEHVGGYAARVVTDPTIGRVVAVDGAGSVVSIFDSRTGRATGSSNAPGQGADLAVDMGLHRAFVTSYTAGVNMIDLRTGAILRTTNIGPDNAFRIAVDSVRHRAFVAALNSRTYGTRLSVLDTRTGLVARAMDLGVTPGSVAVDEQNGRVIVTGSLLNRPDHDPWAWLPTWVRRRLPLPQSLAGQPLISNNAGVAILDDTRL